MNGQEDKKNPAQILCEKKTRQIREVLIMNWAVYTCARFRVNGSALITGVNESGKSTAIDAMVYAMFGITDFNLQAGAGDDERSVYAYVIGDTKDNEERYLRGDRDVTSYIALEVWNPVDHTYLTEGVCIELFRGETRPRSKWFVVPGARIDDFNFYTARGRKISFTARQDLRCKENKVEMMKRDEGIATFLRACGVRLDKEGIRALRGKVKRLLACGRKKMDINSFIRESVFEKDETAAKSLKNIIRHREEYDQLRAALRILNNEKMLLMKIEESYHIFLKEEAVLHRTEIAQKAVLYLRLREHNEALEQEIARYQDRCRALDKQIEKADRSRKKADQSLTELQVALAQQSAPITKMREEITDLKVSLAATREQIDVLNELPSRMDTIFHECEKLPQVEQFFSGGARNVIAAFAQGRYSEQEMAHALQEAETARIALWEYLDKKRITLSIEQRENRAGLERLRHEIGTLRMNRRLLPPAMENELKILRSALKEEGSDAEVRVVCDMVNEIDPKWQPAAESYLAGRRFNIIVEPDVVPAALKIIHDRQLCHLYLVLTNRMEDIPDEPQTGSLAARFTIANPYTRKYINYICSRLICVETLEDLNDHPGGAIMPDGMMAQGIVAHHLEPASDLVLGKDAIEHLLESKKKDLQAADKKRRELDAQLSESEQRIHDVLDEDFAPSCFDLTAPHILPEIEDAINEKTNQLCALEKNPSLKKILDLIVTAQDKKKRTEKLYTDLQAEKVHILTLKEEREKEQVSGRSEEKRLYDEYDQAAALHPEEKAAADELARQDIEKNLKENTIQRRYTGLMAEHDATKSTLFGAMHAYRAAHEGYEVSLSGAQRYIRRLDELRNRDLDVAQNKVREKEKIISDTFMHDFIEVIYARISSMRDQKDAMNRILMRHAFGDKTYSLVMREKNTSEMKPFFYLAKQLEKLGGAGTMDMYLAANQSLLQSGEFADKFAQFRDIVLTASDMDDYTDYRRYYSYDVLVKSRDGHSAYLSKSQGIYSGGGKQTPYFILLTAALLTSYGSEGSCIRLAFIDEAFAALDGSRIQSMIDYFNDMGLQVFYAAPPEKMANISPLVSTTVAVVKKGRQADIIDAQADLML